MTKIAVKKKPLLVAKKKAATKSVVSIEKKPLVAKKKASIFNKILSVPKQVASLVNGKKMEFTIENVKWSWADKVQAKTVYRDDEFVCTNTKEEALQAIDFLLNKPVGLTYSITVFRDDKYYTYYRHTMPCLGGLVKYRDSHGEDHHMNPYFPRDIRVAFPEGQIIYIGCYRASTRSALDFPIYEFMFSQESPWASSFGTKESIIFKDNYFVLTNMDTDPTVFYSLMRLGGFAYHGYGCYGILSKKFDPKAEILATKTSLADPRRLAGQKPIKISGGTWAQGFGYTRPYNESIFKTSLPHKLSQFKTLAGYPQAAYTNTYFVAEMKKIFGLDVNKGMRLEDKGVENALVQAWDHFKIESAELSDVA